ncbi:MAG: sulfatase-like hydrolase/transferase [Pseudomonadota bacterium]
MDAIENILLLSVEDLNDWISPLTDYRGGHPDAYTPNLARLAERSMLFRSAYCAAPACSPSRTATLFGQGPWRNGIYGNEQSWAMSYRPKAKRSIIARAKVEDWRTTMSGKVYHTGKSGQCWADWDATHPMYQEKFEPVSKAVKSDRLRALDDFGPLAQDARTQDDAHVDFTISQMQPRSTGQFWAHGIYRPHLPFLVPQRFFDLIPDEVRLPPGMGNREFDPFDTSELDCLPQHANAMSRTWLGRKIYETGEYLALIRAYLASVAYADYLVGRLLDHLDETGLSENTLIVFWSDHGWQFGEKLAFRKFSLWERSLRVPLMISGPDVPIGRSDEPVSLLDIYPTLLEVVGGDAPHVLDGQSLWPVLNGEKGRGYALSAFRAPSKANPDRPRISLSARGQTHRLIKYFDGTGELYDHRTDPYEKRNLTDPRRKLKEQNLIPEAQELLSILPKVVPQKTLDDLPDHKR